MPEIHDPFHTNMPAPTVQRPLLGLTVLVVEDSRFACDALRLLCLRSGARIRRADCMRSARRHLQVYRPSVAIIDLGLPDGDGIDLLTELSSTPPGEVNVLLAISGESHRRAEALAAGAHEFMEKPITSLAVFQRSILAHIPPDRRPSGLREVVDDVINPDRIALQDDMAHIAEMLDAPANDKTLDYAAQFLSGVARSAKDRILEDAALALARKCTLGEPSNSEVAHLAGLIQQRLSQSIAI
ncbi:MAG: response regulator [Sulfitobacter sp.]